MKQLLILASAVALMTGCAKSGTEISGGQHGADKQIRAISSIEGIATKAVIGQAQTALSGLTFLRLDEATPDQTSGFDFSGKTEITGSSRSSDGTVIFGTVQHYDKESDKTSYMRGFTTGGVTVATGSKAVWVIDGATDILLTDVWNAGRYSSPGNHTMLFRHQLSRIEVICQGEANVAASVVQAKWGDVSYIKLESMMPELTYTYAGDALTASGTAGDFLLLKGTGYNAAEPFEAVAIEPNGGTTVCGSAMVFPQTTTVKLKVRTVNMGEKVVTTTLNALERAKIHTITLTFNTDGQTIGCSASTIEAWTDGTPGSGTVSGN